MHKEEKIFNPKMISKLEHPDRYREIPPVDILKLLGLREGDTFADFGCGVGFFSIPAAEMVGSSGKVFASDISSEMLNGLKERLSEDLIPRVHVCHVGPDAVGDSVEIAPQSVDVGMVSTVLHEVDDALHFLKEVALTLKHGGRLGIVEWHKQSMEKGPRLEIRISEKELEHMLEISGMVLEGSKKLSDRFYLALARKL